MGGVKDQRPARIVALAFAALAAPAPAAETIAYRYDALGRLVKVVRSGGVNEGVVTDYAFDKADNRTTVATAGIPAPVSGTEAADTLTGTAANDTLHGLGGNDVLLAHQGGADRLYGGAGQDLFRMGGSYSAADLIDGGADRDQLVLKGPYPGATLGANVVSVESVAILSSQDDNGGAGSGDPNILFSYDLAITDAFAVAGLLVTFDAAQLRPGETLTFDGSAETADPLRIFGGAGRDTITGGAGNDILVGRQDGDRLSGLAGADIFQLRIGESSGAGYDTIVAFDQREDRIDLPGAVSGFAAAVTSASLSAATFESDLAAAVQSRLGAGQAVTVAVTGGTLAGRLFLVADADGIAGFQAGADFVFEMEAPVVPVSGSVNFFI